MGPSAKSIEVSGRGERFLAYLIDAIVLSIGQVGGGIVGGIVAGVMTSDGISEAAVEQATASGASIGYFFWGAAIWFLNYGILQGMTGSSVGKHALGIKIVKLNGTPIGIARSLGRTAAYVLSALPLYAGFVAIFFTQHHRCWHDFVAGTIAVKRPRARKLVALPGGMATEQPTASTADESSDREAA